MAGESTIDPDELAQVVQALHHSRELLEQLVIRGVRTAGPSELDRLDALREQLAQHGAGHLSQRLGTLLDAMRQDDPGAAGALFRAQASLHLFDRVLTMRVIDGELAASLEAAGSEPA